MDIQFTDLSEVPLPPNEVRIQKFEVEPYPDGKRVRVFLDLTPFQKPPSGEILITDMLGHPVASIHIIEAIDSNMVLTMHLRTADAADKFTARAVVFYSQSLDEITEGDAIVKAPERQIVDKKAVQFEIVR